MYCDTNDKQIHLHEALTKNNKAQEQYRKVCKNWDKDHSVVENMGSKMREEPKILGQNRILNNTDRVIIKAINIIYKRKK